MILHRILNAVALFKFVLYEIKAGTACDKGQQIQKLEVIIFLSWIKSGHKVILCFFLPYPYDLGMKLFHVHICDLILMFQLEKNFYRSESRGL